MKIKSFIKKGTHHITCPVCGEEVELTTIPHNVTPEKSLSHKFYSGETVEGTTTCGCRTYLPGEIDLTTGNTHLSFLNKIDEYSEQTENSEYLNRYSELDRDNWEEVESLRNFIDTINEEEHNEKFRYVRFSISETGYTEYSFPLVNDTEFTNEELSNRINVYGNSDEIAFLNSIEFEALSDLILKNEVKELELGNQKITITIIPVDAVHEDTDIYGNRIL